MPCNTVQRSKVELLANTTDKSLLARGLRAKGYTVHETTNGLSVQRYGRAGSYDARTGKLTIPEQWDSQEFKRAYSREIVTQQAEQGGWSVEWSTNEQGQDEAIVQKASY
jgi:hypothetical protein